MVKKDFLFLGVNCSMYKKIVSLEDYYKVVKYTNKYSTFYKKIDDKLVECSYNDEYKHLLENDVILEYKNYYILKNNTEIQKEVNQRFINEKNYMKNFMGGLIYESIDDLCNFKTCKNYINEIKNKNNMADFFKKRLCSILTKNQEEILNLI